MRKNDAFRQSANFNFQKDMGAIRRLKYPRHRPIAVSPVHNAVYQEAKTAEPKSIFKTVEDYAVRGVRVAAAVGTFIGLSKAGAIIGEKVLDGHKEVKDVGDALGLPGLKITGFDFGAYSPVGVASAAEGNGIYSPKGDGLPHIDPKKDNIGKGKSASDTSRKLKKSGYRGPFGIGVASAAPYTPPNEFPVPEHPEKKVGGGSWSEFYAKYILPILDLEKAGEVFLKNTIVGRVLGYGTETSKADPCVEYANKKVDDKGNEVIGKPGLDVGQDVSCSKQIEDLKQKRKIASATSVKQNLGASPNNGSGGVQGSVNGLDSVYNEIKNLPAGTNFSGWSKEPKIYTKQAGEIKSDYIEAVFYGACNGGNALCMGVKVKEGTAKKDVYGGLIIERATPWNPRVINLGLGEKLATTVGIPGATTYEEDVKNIGQMSTNGLYIAIIPNLPEKLKADENEYVFSAYSNGEILDNKLLDKKVI